MEDVYLPEELREKMRDSWGSSFFGQEKEVTEKVKKFLKENPVAS